MSITLAGLAESYRSMRRFPDRNVHPSATGIRTSSATANHVYLCAHAHRPHLVHLAQMSDSSGGCEVALMRINSFYIVQVGSRPYSGMRFCIPPRHPDITRARFIAHTHPEVPQDLRHQHDEMETSPSGEDRDALILMSGRFGQSSSLLINSFRGQIRSVLRFRVSGRDQAVPAGRWRARYP